MTVTISGYATRAEMNRTVLAMRGTDGAFLDVHYAHPQYFYKIEFDNDYQRFCLNFNNLAPIIEKTSSRWTKLKRKIIGHLKGLV